MGNISASLILESDVFYQSHVKRARQRSRSYRSLWAEKSNSSFDIELLRWEKHVLSCLNQIIPSIDERVIKYSQNGRVNYQELDHIVKTESGLILCELKLKKRYSDNLNRKYTGWHQLDRALTLLRNGWGEVSGASICVDMSSIYGEPIEAGSSYVNLGELPELIRVKNSSLDVIWIDGRELLDFAFTKGIIKASDVSRFRELYNDRHLKSAAPLQTTTSFLFGRERPNNPFACLQSII